MTTHNRYHRQSLLLGDEGQARLERSHALIVGLGALGSHAADTLARAGVGTLTIVDRDLVEETNLQRQVLYSERDVGLPKAQAARERLAAVNSTITIHAHATDVTPRTITSLMQNASPPINILIDGTDNLETRYLLNDVAVKHGLPLAYAGVVAAHGMQYTILPKAAFPNHATPCLRCLFEELPGTIATCDTVGVLAPAVAIVAGAQAADAIKILAGRIDLVSRSLLEFDLWQNTRRRLDLAGPRDDCPCCGRRSFEFLDGRFEREPIILCGQNAVQVETSSHAAIATATTATSSAFDLAAIAQRWQPLGEVTLSPFMARLSPTDQKDIDITLFKDGRAIIRGTTNVPLARSLYARFVGA
jgi:adenylyltransferase/sulfurtransferase